LSHLSLKRLSLSAAAVESAAVEAAACAMAACVLLNGYSSMRWFMFSSLLLCARHYRIVAVPLCVLLFAAEDGLRFVLSALASSCFFPYLGDWTTPQQRFSRARSGFIFELRGQGAGCSFLMQ
jgi:hypothetical protein